MSWKTQLTRKNKRRLAKTTSAASSLLTAEKASIAKEILAAMFQHMPHQGTGANAKRTPMTRQPTDDASRPEYRCQECDTMNWCDRSLCRICKHPRPTARSAGAGPARRAPGPRTGANARTGATAVAISPGQQAEELKQAAQKAIRAGATADAVKPLVEQERECRARQAAAKSSKPLDMARAAVEQATAAVSTADAAIATAEAAVVAARQRAADARDRLRDKAAELERVEALRAENLAAGHASLAVQVPVALQKTAQNLLAKAQCVTTSLENFMRIANVDANLSIPEDFRREVEDLKLAMATAQQVQQTLQVSATASLAPNTDIRNMLNTTKKLMELLENGRVGAALPDHVVDCMATVNQSILAIEPVGAAKLCEPIEPECPDAKDQAIEDDSMETEACLNATATAIMEQIRNASDEDALETIQKHLRTFRGKGDGKGSERYTPGCG